MNRAEPAGLYIHVPFCKSKCSYCDFYSVTSLELTEEWLKAVKAEAIVYRDRFGSFDSLYLGGGTPSLLNGREMTELLEHLHRHFRFSPGTEITVEVNPDDVTREKIELFKSLGVNRISVGVQSFHEGELKFLGRRHSARQAVEALGSIRSGGFDNLGIDLIFGFDAGDPLEGSVRQRWLESLEAALELQPEHLSCYQMTIAKDTPLGRMKDGRQWSTLGEEGESELFLLTSHLLEERGYTHYEISNYARGPGFVSRHNSKYWSRVPYLGLGPAAHSLLDGRRWWNERSIEKYCRALSNRQIPVAGAESLTPEQIRMEALLLGLRTSSGVEANLLPKEEKTQASVDELVRSGLLSRRFGKLIPTRRGYLVADSLPLLLLP